MIEMKGITCCGDCIHYNWKKHKCNLGCNDEGLATDHFYKDCPLPKVQPVNQWIPCSERLPDEPEYGVDGYIVQSKDIAEPYSAYWGEDETWTDSDCNVIDDVIAWMPLPEPYKEGGTDG